MKYALTALAFTAGLAGVMIPTAGAGTHKRPGAPVVITPPAIPNGSNASRAPFPAARPQNDVTPPNGEAFDQNLPPNTPATTPAPLPPPPAAVAILRPRAEPELMPTGRVAVASDLDVARMQPTIRTSAFATRDELIDGIRARVRQSQEGMAQMRRTESEMSASGRTEFRTAAGEVRARERALDRSLRAASRASAETWESARAQLAADYAAYAAALARVDAAAGVR